MRDFFPNMDANSVAIQLRKSLEVLTARQVQRLRRAHNLVIEDLSRVIYGDAKKTFGKTKTVEEWARGRSLPNETAQLRFCEYFDLDYLGPSPIEQIAFVHFCSSNPKIQPQKEWLPRGDLNVQLPPFPDNFLDLLTFVAFWWVLWPYATVNPVLEKPPAARLLTLIAAEPAKQTIVENLRGPELLTAIAAEPPLLKMLEEVATKLKNLPVCGEEVANQLGFGARSTSDVLGNMLDSIERASKWV